MTYPNTGTRARARACWCRTPPIPPPPGLSTPTRATGLPRTPFLPTRRHQSTIVYTLWCPHRTPQQMQAAMRPAHASALQSRRCRVAKGQPLSPPLDPALACSRHCKPLRCCHAHPAATALVPSRAAGAPTACVTRATAPGCRGAAADKGSLAANGAGRGMAIARGGKVQEIIGPSSVSMRQARPREACAARVRGARVW